MSLAPSCEVTVVGGGAAGTAAAIGAVLHPTLKENRVNSMEQVGIECITPSPTSNGAHDTFQSDWHWSLGDWRRKVGHEGNE